MKGILPVSIISLALVSETNALTISRLQYRMSDQDTWSITESVFHRWDNSLYVLQIYNRDHDTENDHDNERHELYLGRPVFINDQKQVYGIVGRVQKWSSFEAVPSAGVELNFNQLPVLDDALSHINVRSFIQLHRKFKDNLIGTGEILHYYQVNNLFGSELYLRGYNMYHTGGRDLGGDNFQAFADWIFPLHKTFDVYLRTSYLRRESPQLGSQGGSTEIGFRYNF